MVLLKRGLLGRSSFSMMEHGELASFFKHSAVVRLMRAENAPYVLDFFYRAFKDGKRIEIEQEILLASLKDFQDDLEELNVLQRSAEEYLSEWCGEKCRYLKRFLANDSNVWMIQLQPEAEDVLRFLEGVFAKQDGLISTGSRLQMIVDAVKELVLYASGDLEAQKDQLRRERDRIEAKLQALESSEVGEVIDEREVQERLVLLTSMLRDLTGDFRGVEQKFREIVQGMREREVLVGERTGDVLSYVLDSEDALREHPHGASFYAFVSFVLSAERRDSFDEMVGDLRGVEALRESVHELDRLEGMVPLLTDEATKILSTTQRLSAALRRLLDPRASEEHRRLKELLQETMRGFGQCEMESKDESLQMQVDLGVDIDSPMTRDFWKPRQRFEKVQLEGGDQEQELVWQKQALEQYSALRRLDWKGMEKKIGGLLKSREKVALQELLVDEVLEAGLVEVLGYIQLAHDGGHVVDEGRDETIVVRLEDGEKRVKVPKVVFIKK